MSTHTTGVLLVSSFPPRECGLATFSEDLYNALTQQFHPSFSLRICALEDTPHPRSYDNRVTYTLHSHDIGACVDTARKINADPAVQLVCVQHEFGLFGGSYGSHVLSFLYTLEKPVVICFHTVLPEPDSERLQLVQAIASVAQKVVVMTKVAAEVLEHDYAVEAGKIEIIKHGTHLTEWKDKKALKQAYGFENRLVLSTFGLLSANKSLETGIAALATIKESFPNVLYLILGRTHPGVVRNEGEQYRQQLEAQVEALNLQDNVLFVNKYLALDELLDYLSLTDVYLFTSKDPHQAVSGTFIYAMSCACPIVSTPIQHAKAALTEDMGLFFDFFDSDQLAQAVCRLLGDEDLRHRMSLNAYHHTRDSIWENVAIAYAELFKPFVLPDRSLTYALPPLTLKHLNHMTDDFGLFQFAHIATPATEFGYTLDDNARALLVLTLYQNLYRNEDNYSRIVTYWNLIRYCQQPDGGFLNYMNLEREFTTQNDTDQLEDACGRAIWATGVLLSHGANLPRSLSEEAHQVLTNAIPRLRQLQSPRSMAFVLKGICPIYQQTRNRVYEPLIIKFANRLVELYRATADAEWKWFEGYLTYANAILPEALLWAYEATGTSEYRDIAQESFDFLLCQSQMDTYFQAVSCHGWQTKGASQRNDYGEQSIDIGYTIIALDRFYRITGEEKYRRSMELAFSWYLGNNRIRQIIYNPVSGGCFDGLESHGVNQNQGAESTVCYLMARLVMEKYQTHPPRPRLPEKQPSGLPARYLATGR